MKKVKQWILPGYVIFHIAHLFLLSYFYIMKQILYRQYAKSLRILFYINLSLIFLSLLYKMYKKQKIKFQKSDFFLLLIAIFAYLSYLFAIKQKVALFGSTGRYEGMYIIYYYLTLYYITSFLKEKQKKKVVYAILFFGAIQAFYSIFQYLRILRPLEINNIIEIRREFHDGKVWATGFLRNPNFFGSYVLIMLCYSIGLFMDSKKKNFVYLSLIALFLISLEISNTLSVFVGFLVVLLFLFIYCFKKKLWKRYLVVMLIFVCISGLLVARDKTTLFKDLIKTGGEAKEISTGNFDDTYGTKRMFVWKQTIKKVPDYLWTGAGIDNFLYAFGEAPLKRKNVIYDKAHNEYLQILITEGIFAFVSYLSFYGILVTKEVKRSFKKKEVMYLLPVIGYLVQAFFNISVIDVAPIFYISLGLITRRE